MRSHAWRNAALLVGALAIGAPMTSVFAQDEEELPNGSERMEADQDNATDRLQWERETWGVVTPQFRKLELKQANIHNSKKNQPGPRWASIGPTGASYEQNGSFTGHVQDSGRARAILFHPDYPDTVFALTSGGGLWRTDNWSAANIQWRPLTDDLTTTGGGSVAFGRNPNTLYLGLGDPYDQILAGGAVAKSKNGGVSWAAPVELGNAVSVRDIKVDTSGKTDAVLVATDNGLFRSADEGVSYSAVAAFAGMSVWSIQRTSAGWLASAQNCPAANVGLQCGFATTLMLSTDRGATWSPITNTGGVFSANGRTTLAVAAPGEAVVYAYSSTQSDGAMRDVYRSSDGGQTWVANNVNSTKIPTNPVPGATNQPNMNICGGQCWYNQSIAVDPSDPNRNTVWIGGNLATAQTTDGGTTWTLKTWWLYSQVPSLPYAHADHHVAAFKTTGTPALVLGDDGGWNISEDGGATFSDDKNTGLTTHLYYTVAGTPDFPNLVIGGLQDNGTRLRTDNGTIHNQVIGGDGMGAAYSQANTNTSMGSSQSSGIRLNLDNNPPAVFQQWTARGTLSDGAGAGFFTAIVPAPAALDATGRVFFHFTNSRVFRTNNGGLTFSIIGSATAPTSPGLPAARRFRSSPYNLGVDPTDLNRIAIGAGGGFLDITTNGGASWTDINLIAAVPPAPGYPSGYQGFVTNVTWQDDTNIWITSVAQLAGSARVVKATIANSAASWSTATYTVLQSGLPDLPITRVYFDPRDATKQTIYAATHVGLYRTIDGGSSWAPFGNGLPTVRVNDIYMPPDGSFMRIATYGRGIWALGQIELAGATIADNGVSCDSDGVLDNGETGTLTVSLKNQGPANVNQGKITVSSDNPHVTFPSGNVIPIPPLNKGFTIPVSIPVALAGAVGIEQVKFSLAINAPELALSSAFNVSTTQRVNYDEVPNGSATETFELSTPGWSTAGDPLDFPNVLAWQTRALSPVEHVAFGPDNNGQVDDTKTSLADQRALTSPVLNVGTDPLVISFSHRYSFENGRFDGGVVELSADGGVTWTDIGLSAYTNTILAGTPLGARPAFVNRIAGWPSFSTVTLNLGTTYANQNVQIRFHIGADNSTGAPGWDIDNVAISGITNTPFTAMVPEAGTCSP